MQVVWTSPQHLVANLKSAVQVLGLGFLLMFSFLKLWVPGLCFCCWGFLGFWLFHRVSKRSL
jgi:hypothetical protein